MNAAGYRNIIEKAMPPELVIPRHDERGHFYEINIELEKKLRRPKKYFYFEGDKNPIYPSVTGKLQILKDESVINYKMNRAIEYVFANWEKFNQMNVAEHLDNASKAAADIFQEAGDIGTDIHDCREKFFKQWMKTGIRPEKATDFISYDSHGMQIQDVRVVSALRALDQFCTDWNYVPIASELFVYSHQLKIAGTLDDLGTMVHYKNPAGSKWQFVLMDIKTSNQFKDHYFFQVALYFWMLRSITGLVPERCFILKLSKTDGTYKLEDLKRPAMLGSYARSMLRLQKGIDYIKGLRKDNQKIVAEKIDL